MNKIKKILLNKYIIGSFIVTIIYIIFLYIKGAYPFSTNTILTGDLKEQYVNFYCYLKQVLLNQKGITISWNLGTMNSFYTTFIYYLMSPLNLLALFFNSSNMYIFIELLLYIKLILIYNSMVLYLDKVLKLNKISIIFGLAYIFSSFITSYWINIMWLDILYLMPIALIFIEKFIEYDKEIYKVVIIYIISIIINYYMAYMMILFCSLYFIAKYFIKYDINKENFKKFFHKLFKLFLFTLISVGTTMFIFLPTLKQLNSLININTNMFCFNKSNLENIINVFSYQYDYRYCQKLGFYFSSSFISILLMLFIFNKDIKKIKEKIIYGIFFIIMMLPVISPLIYKIWHGGTMNNMLNFRYSYATIFLMIIIAAESYKNIDSIRKKDIILITEIFLILNTIEVFTSIGGILSGNMKYLNSIIVGCIIVIAMIICLSFILFKKNNRKIKLIFSIILYTIVIIEIAYCFLLRNNSYSTSINEYNRYEKIIAYIKDINILESTDRINIENDEIGNLSLRYDFGTTKFFSSGRNLNILNNFKKIGYLFIENNIKYHYKTWLNDSIAGVKLLINDYSEQNHMNNIYQYLESYENKYNIYLNEAVFPFGYYSSQNIETQDVDNPLEVQNLILNYYGKKDDESYIKRIEEKNDIAELNSNMEEKDKNVKIEYNIKAKKDTTVYVLANNTMEIYLPNEEFSYVDENMITEICSLKENQDYNFEINIYKDDYNSDSILIYAIDDEKAKNKILTARDNTFETEKMKKNIIQGTANFKEDGYLCFQITYDDGWNAFVDGKKVETEDIYGCFLGVKLEKGEHNIKLVYKQPYLKEGIIISLSSLIILISLKIIESKKETRRDK